MNGISIWQRSLGRHALALGLAVIGPMLAGQAVAGCGQFVPQLSPPAQSWPELQGAGLMKAVYRPGEGRFLRVDDRESREAGIAGTWRFTFVSDGTAYPQPIPVGAVVDFGTVQWHSDGTEFMISGARPPSAGDVCMGSWEQTGRFTYKLKHIGLSWISSDSTPSSTPATYLGPAIIREVVTLNREGNAFEGTFTIDQYAKDEVTLLEHISGKVSATRFLAD